MIEGITTEIIKIKQVLLVYEFKSLRVVYQLFNLRSVQIRVNPWSDSTPMRSKDQ